MATPKFPTTDEETLHFDHLALQLAERHVIPVEWALRFVTASYRIAQLLCHKQRGYGPGNIQVLGERGVFNRIREKSARLENLKRTADLETFRSGAARCVPYDDKREEEDDIAGLGIILGMIREGEWPDVEEGTAL